MRILSVKLLVALPGLALAQSSDPYGLIKNAVSQTLGQPQVYIGVNGWERLGGEPAIQQKMRFYIQGNKFQIEAYVNDDLRLFLLADGTKIWRYDPRVKEYTFVKQPEDFGQAFGVAAAFARAESQRMVRLFAGSVNWLVNPKADAISSNVHLYATTPTGQNDWRGSDVHFVFDGDYGKLSSVSTEDRIDLADGKVKRAASSATFIYNRTFNFEFRFTPPPGSKPAADLPHRIGGG